MIDAQTVRLDSRLALVSGSSSGIGLALARGLAPAGASVALNRRDPAELTTAAAALSAEGLVVHARAFDVTGGKAALPAIAEIDATLGLIEGLINTAGMTRRAPFHDGGVPASL